MGVRSNGMGSIRRLAVLGGGIARLPDRLARDDLESGRLVRVLPGWSAPQVSVYAIAENRLLPARTQVFVDFLRKRIERDADGAGDRSAGNVGIRPHLGKLEHRNDSSFKDSDDAELQLP